jgi:hypothetical protein
MELLAVKNRYFVQKKTWNVEPVEHEGFRPAGCEWVSVGFSGFLYRWISLATIFNNSQLVVNSDG